MSKKCGRCGRRRSNREFYRKASSSDGLAPWCKRCQNRETETRRERERKLRTFGSLSLSEDAAERQIQRRKAIIREEKEKEERRCGKRDSRTESYLG